jgi:hypothetical protein
MVLKNSVKNNPDIPVDDLFQAQGFVLLKPIPQPVAHGNDEKGDYVVIASFIQVRDFFKLILQKMKDGLFSPEKVSPVLSGQLMPFA